MWSFPRTFEHVLHRMYIILDPDRRRRCGAQGNSDFLGMESTPDRNSTNNWKQSPCGGSHARPLEVGTGMLSVLIRGCKPPGMAKYLK